MVDAREVLQIKAEERLAGAESEMVAPRYNHAANRCYHACYQAAVVALRRAGIQPPRGATDQWGHAAVQADFVGLLINQRKRYPADLRAVLGRGFSLRQSANYTRDRVSECEARLVLRRSREFVEAIWNG